MRQCRVREQVIRSQEGRNWFGKASERDGIRLRRRLLGETKVEGMLGVETELEVETTAGLRAEEEGRSLVLWRRRMRGGEHGGEGVEGLRGERVCVCSRTK